MTSTYDQQARLSDDLQLLHFFSRHSLSGSHSGHQLFTKNVDIELKLLDSIALYLINDIPDDTVAVAFDTSTSRIQFILARNTTPTDQDIRIATSFFATIVTLRNTADILELALHNSHHTVKQRIRKCSEIDMDVIDKLLRAYKFSDITEEFEDTPSIVNQLAEMWSISDPHSMLRQAFIEMLALSADLAKPEVVVTKERFTRLSTFTYFIVRSCFFRDYNGFREDPRDLRIRKYKRRLHKLA